MTTVSSLHADLDWAAVAARFKALYTPAVCDVLDGYGLRHQFMTPGLIALEADDKVAGPAFTILGRADANLDTSTRMGPRVIDSFEPQVVAVYDTSGETHTGVWGELWSAGAQRMGCVGAIVDGGIRDSALIKAIGFPIFHRFRSPADAVGRFTVIDHQTPVTVGGVRVYPGDYIFGDQDGVVVIPRDLTLEVLEKAETVKTTEDDIRTAIGEGGKLIDLYKKHGRF
ncbi:RraA family protein [Brevundimonas sp. NIBR11]|uniref:RraA family protein n=1 Tax=Brevundimonas sp. NIBR11 TaxID=3015999 RepID=UPI0022F08730|nr:RraA family protein [Brevundimonas sp. NIBR11]WGM30587.1 4-hydroxy-4-methyl-2-oxoglutarate aldolase/4-carboxy-4-hydroxy-2-oxoadipate aldolase [Brevundimonas sp. NIBR11]